MKWNIKTRPSDDGFTLIEMLVSVVIFIFVILAVYSLFDQGQWLYLHSERRSNIQDNGRVAMEQLERDLRMIGAGVPIQTQEGSSTVLTPFVFQAEPAAIAFRGDVDNRNTRLKADASGTPLSVEDADAVCGAVATPIVITKNMKKWAPLGCTVSNPTSIAISSGTVPSYTAEEALIVTPEHVFYRLVRADTLTDGDTNDDGICDYTNIPYCTLQRYEEAGNGPLNAAPVGASFQTVATNIQKLRFQYLTSTGTDLGYPTSGGAFYAIQRVFASITLRDRASEAGKFQDINLSADVLVRDARY